MKKILIAIILLGSVNQGFAAYCGCADTQGASSAKCDAHVSDNDYNCAVACSKHGLKETGQRSDQSWFSHRMDTSAPDTC